MMDEATKKALKQCRKVEKLIYDATEVEIQKGNLVFDDSGKLVPNVKKKENV